MNARGGDRVGPVVLSVLIHAAIVATLVWGWWFYRRPTAAPPTLAIEATVVSHAPPSPPTPPAPPVPDAAAEQKAAQRKAAEEAQQKLEQQRAEEQRAREQSERAAAEAEAQRVAQEQKARQAKEELERKVKEEAERKAKADAERKAQELAQQRKTQQALAQRQAELRSQLAAEEHLNELQSSPAKAEYLSLITAKINRAWSRPPSARPGVKCIVHLTQVPGGEITNVRVTGCNGDEAVRQSVETAAYKASPLPVPSDPALFDPNIDVTFAPDE